MASLEYYLPRIGLGRSILFLGAGFSTLSTNISDTHPPAGGKLRQIMASALDEPDDLSLETLSEEYINSKNEDGILALLRSNFTIKQISESQKKLLSHPWRQIYTTNFDDSAELAATAAGKQLEKAVLSDEPSAYGKGSACIHLNGLLERTNINNVRESLVLTSTQYASDKIQNSRWASVLRTDFDLADSIFFVGYSLFDIDIERILFRNPNNIEKTFFIIGTEVSRATELKVKKYGTLTNLDADSFAEALGNTIPVTSETELFLTNFEEPPRDTPTSSPLRDEAVISFLVEGDLDLPLLYTDIANSEQNYHIDRDAARTLAEQFVHGQKRALVHSNIGNGKSVFVDIASYFLLNAGFRVFFHNPRSDDYARDIQYLEKVEEKYVIVMEDAYSNSDTINLILDSIPYAPIIATARTATYEIRGEKIKRILRDDYSIFDLNALTLTEIHSTKRFLDRYGLWGERSGLSDRNKINFIQRSCNSEFRTILLSVLGSDALRQRLSPLVQKIGSGNSIAQRGFVATLALAYAEYPVSIGALSELLQADLFRSAKTHDDEVLREFIDLRNSRIRARSPLFAEYILTKIIPDSIVIDVITSALTRLDRLALDQKRYKIPLRKMTRFGFIERILEETDKPKKLVSFYEELRRTGVGERDPQFWLQYAIARMSFEDYGNAERYFNTAFSLADRRKGYDTYQIDNQFSKFLLESRYKSKKWTDFFEAFKAAHDTLSKQMNNTKEGYYPYRVAKLYLEFIEALHNEFDSEQMHYIRESCTEVLQLIDRASAEMKKRLYVRDCKIAMLRSIEFIDEVS